MSIGPLAYAEYVAARYRSAYGVAVTLETFGTIIKIAGGAAGMFIAGIGVLGATYIELHTDMPEVVLSALSMSLATIVFGAVVFGLAFALGVLVTALGQILKAQLDTAVNTSPFLDDLTKARSIGVA